MIDQMPSNVMQPLGLVDDLRPLAPVSVDTIDRATGDLCLRTESVHANEGTGSMGQPNVSGFATGEFRLETAPATKGYWIHTPKFAPTGHSQRWRFVT
ncbi:MAG: hypothetical protein AAGD35_13690 [Actinomycetota bacterium]